MGHGRVRLTVLVGAIVAVACAAQARKALSVGPVILEPGPPGTFDDVAVKDPSIVRFEGNWHLFYTARDRSTYTLAYAKASEIQDLGRAKRHPLLNLHSGKSKYAAAPQVFYFQPQHKWYLIYQTDESNYQPVYSTTGDINSPKSWTPPQPLVMKAERAKWIDFWVICDERNAYLFFTRDHKEVVVMSTRREDFPSGFSEPRVVFAPVHEAVHVYRTKGRNAGYVMFYEQQEKDIRRFGLARARKPDGKWEVVDERFASAERLAPSSGRWTDEVSHGELLRSGADEYLEIPTRRWDILIQGLRNEQHRGAYTSLPWRLGLITAAGL